MKTLWRLPIFLVSLVGVWAFAACLRVAEWLTEE